MVTSTSPTQDAPLIAFAGGGTGGHLFPALAIAEALRRRVPTVRIVFFATERPIDRRVLNTVECDVVTQTLPAVSAKPWRWPGVLRGFYQSQRQCRSSYGRRRPAIVIGTGGLGSVPAVREAHRAGIVTAIINPDIYPGRANRHLARFCDVVFAQFDETADRFPPSTTVEVEGCPVRRAFTQADRGEGCRRFNLDPNLKTLLITGASQGARSINEAVVANLPFLSTMTGWQIVHLTGEPDFAAVEKAYRDRKIPAVILPFTDHMASALGAADLVVARAGASFLAEITAVGRASIMMPYPHHKDQHQRANANSLARVGAAMLVDDAIDTEANGQRVRVALELLMTDDLSRESMALAARQHGRPNAAERIAERVLALAGVEVSRTCETMEAVC